MKDIMDFPKDSVAYRLRQERSRRGWTQKQLAQKAGVAQGTVHNLECGRHLDSDYRTIYAMAKTLGVTTEYLMGKPELAAIRMKALERQNRVLIRALQEARSKNTDTNEMIRQVLLDQMGGKG